MPRLGLIWKGRSLASGETGPPFPVDPLLPLPILPSCISPRVKALDGTFEVIQPSSRLFLIPSQMNRLTPSLPIRIPPQLPGRALKPLRTPPPHLPPGCHPFRAGLQREAGESSVASRCSTHPLWHGRRRTSEPAAGEAGRAALGVQRGSIGVSNPVFLLPPPARTVQCHQGARLPVGGNPGASIRSWLAAETRIGSQLALHLLLPFVRLTPPRPPTHPPALSQRSASVPRPGEEGQKGEPLCFEICTRRAMQRPLPAAKREGTPPPPPAKKKRSGILALTHGEGAAPMPEAPLQAQPREKRKPAGKGAGRALWWPRKETAGGSERKRRSRRASDSAPHPPPQRLLNYSSQHSSPWATLGGGC